MPTLRGNLGELLFMNAYMRCFVREIGSVLSPLGRLAVFGKMTGEIDVLFYLEIPIVGRC